MTTHRTHDSTSTPLARAPGGALTGQTGQATPDGLGTRPADVRMLVPGVGDGISRPRLGLRSRG